MAKPIYLDYAAATPTDQAVLKVMDETNRQLFSNPSSAHGAGQAAKQALEAARHDLAQRLMVKASELIFTAGATEANWLALAGLKAAEGGLIACLAIDHDSIRQQADVILPVEAKTGQLALDQVAQLDDRVGLLSLAAVNSELGVLQPLAKIKAQLGQVRRARQAAGCQQPLRLHIDASQMAGCYSIQPHRLGADLLTINGAKIYGPKQSAALFIRQGISLKPQLVGGGQEHGLRPGTESLPAARGLALAYCLAQSRQADTNRHLRTCQHSLETSLQALGAQPVLPAKLRSPHISNLIFPGQDNERLMFKLSQAQIYVGLGSACQASQPASTSLIALGLSESQARASLRFSYGLATTPQQLKRLVSCCQKLLD